MTEAVWDDATATWTIRTRDRNGASTNYPRGGDQCRRDNSTGPHLPLIDGQDAFSGTNLSLRPNGTTRLTCAANGLR